MKNTKRLLAVICAVLLVGISAVGTVAYLTDKTEEVNNTFSIGKLLDDPSKFVLLEHEAKDEDKDGVYQLDRSSEVKENSYTVLPGVDLPKDPFVRTDEELKLDAYVFIEVKDATGSALHFSVDDNKWTELAGKTGPQGGKVYVMKANNGIVEAGTKLGPITILTDNKITVDNAEITDAAKQFGGDVKFYGYMIQAGGFSSAADAWAKGFAPAETESES